LSKSFLNRFLSIIIISLLVNMVIIAAVGPVSAQSISILYVDPRHVIDTTKTAGTDFTINVNVKDITDFYGYQIKLRYNTTVLDVNTVTLGSFFPSDSVLWVSEENRINEAGGYVWYILTMPYGAKYGVDGSGTLLSISFNVTSIGETILDLEALEVFNHKMKEMPRNVYDCYFSNILRHTRLYVDPEKKIDLDLVPSKNFTINVNVFNVTNLHSSEFKLNYDTRILDVLKVTEGSFMASFGETNFVSGMNETLGLVEVNVTLVDPIGATTPNWPKAGNGTLAIVTFNVTAIGGCDLYLYNTKLTDPTATPIKHYPFEGGYFNNKDIVHDIVITDVKTTVTTVVVEDGVSVPVSKPVSEIYAGEKVNVTVFLKNDGNILEDFNVTAYYNVTHIGIPMNITLSDGFVTSVVFEWNTEGVEVGSYIIWAEASPVLGETIEDQINNKFTMKNEFKVLGGGSLPVELVVTAVAGVFIIAVAAVYLMKFRKPKPVAEAH